MPCQACGCRKTNYKMFKSRILCKKHYDMFVKAAEELEK